MSCERFGRLTRLQKMFKICPCPMTRANQSTLNSKPRGTRRVRLWVVADGKNFAHITRQASKGRMV